ncbi:HAD family hydrolase [Salinifilum ghardaiensis]
MAQPDRGVEGAAEAGRLAGTAEEFRAVVFDMDGVLVESEHLWERMWARFAAARGKEWTAEQTRQVQGMSAPEWAAFLTEFSGAGDSPVDTERAVVDDMIAALDGGEVEPLAGAARMVAEVSEVAPIALASSAPRRLIDAVLVRNGLEERFSATVSSAEVARGKPNPDVYLAAAERLGGFPERCLAVEDSSNGLRAAAAAGMTVVAHPNRDYPPAEDALAGSAYTAGSLDEVRHYLVGALAQPTRG